MNKYYFAVDLGASSGRTMIARIDSGKIEMEEINRFPNHIIDTGGHCYWDILELYRNILDGLKKFAARKDVELASIGIDTWGVDFVLVGKDGHFLGYPYSYRDQHTADAPEKYFSRVSREDVYKKTGIQVMNFNSLFQFDTLSRAEDSAWKAADKILFMPDALGYMLTGKAVTEYTIASTAQIVNAAERCLDRDILGTLGLNETKFGTFVFPGQKIGILTAEVQRLTGLGPVPVVSVAGHDTASAVAATPALTGNFAYLSSGTWSLMGVETESPVINADTEALNYTNEGGVDGTIRLLKNICGMWLLESCRKIWGNVPYQQLISEAEQCEAFRFLINPDDDSFANPDNMEDAICSYCREHGGERPESRGEIVRCIFDSLALRYKDVLNHLRRLSPHPIEVLHVIGGGSCNAMLNQFTANATGIPVIAGPSEATAIGNVMIQAISDGVADSVADMRKLVSRSIPQVRYEPQDCQAWEEAYKKFIVKTKSL